MIRSFIAVICAAMVSISMIPDENVSRKEIENEKIEEGNKGTQEDSIRESSSSDQLIDLQYQINETLRRLERKIDENKIDKDQLEVTISSMIDKRLNDLKFTSEEEKFTQPEEEKFTQPEEEKFTQPEEENTQQNTQQSTQQNTQQYTQQYNYPVQGNYVRGYRTQRYGLFGLRTRRVPLFNSTRSFRSRSFGSCSSGVCR